MGCFPPRGLWCTDHCSVKHRWRANRWEKSPALNYLKPSQVCAFNVRKVPVGKLLWNPRLEAGFCPCVPDRLVRKGWYMLLTVAASVSWVASIIHLFIFSASRIRAQQDGYRKQKVLKLFAKHFSLSHSPSLSYSSSLSLLLRCFIKRMLMYPRISQVRLLLCIIFVHRPL